MTMGTRRKLLEHHLEKGELDLHGMLLGVGLRQGNR